MRFIYGIDTLCQPFSYFLLTTDYDCQPNQILQKYSNLLVFPRIIKDNLTTSSQARTKNVNKQKSQQDVQGRRNNLLDGRIPVFKVLCVRGTT